MKQKSDLAAFFLVLSLVVLLALFLFAIVKGPFWSALLLGFIMAIEFALAVAWYRLAKDETSRLFNHIVRLVAEQKEQPPENSQPITDDMSDIERRILDLWIEGRSGSEIASSIGYVDGSIYNIISRLRKKYGEEVVPSRRSKRL